MDDFGEVWAEINYDHLCHNLRMIREYLSFHTKIMAIVKADAYGHGLGEIARRLMAEGIDYFGVASVGEGKELIQRGITQPVLVLRSVLSEQMEELLHAGLVPSVNCIDAARSAELYGKKNRKKVRIHVKVDTGSEGDGIPFNDCSAFFGELAKLDWLIVEGIYTHLVAAYGQDRETVSEQLNRFGHTVALAREAGINPSIIHAASSPGIFDFPEAHFDMVRVGTALYGLALGENRTIRSLKPVLQLKSKVICIKEFQVGNGFEYGKKYLIREPVRVATVAIGYADAPFLMRAKNFKVLIAGELFPLYGDARMDHIKVNITGCNKISVGAEVVIIGDDGIHEVTAADAAGASDIKIENCESICFLGKRVRRVYLEQGKVLKVQDI